MHEASVSVCPITHSPILRASGASAVKPSAPKAISPPKPGLVIPRPAVEVATPPGPPPRSARRSLIGQTIDGKYRVISVLGEGGMGTVFEAEHAAIGRLVAMKVLHPAQATKTVAVKRFHQEARAAGGIGHPNICEVFDFGTLTDGSPYLVMERLKGETLAARILTEHGLPLGEVIDAVLQVLSGLAAAHDRGILHRDIKPENVFLAERPGYPPTAKLLDFGVSKVIASGGADWDDETDLTKTGMVMGTPYYMSPEQARGERTLDARLDLYAVGVLLYEALTGQRPFIAKNYNALLMLILSSNPAPPRSLRPNIPEELERIVLKAMSKNRDDRFASAVEFSRALAATRRNLGKAMSGARTTSRPAANSSGSQSSADIPIHFVEVEEVLASDEWDQTTVPMMEPPSDHLIEELSPDDDENPSQNTIKLDSDDLVLPKPRSKDDSDERTERMDPREIRSMVDAVRQARERGRPK